MRHLDSNTLAESAVTPSKLGDTGWVSLTLNSGFSGLEGLGVRRIGSTVYLRGAVRRNAGNYPATETAVATLPLEFRPPEYIRIILPTYASTGSGANGSVYAAIGIDGTVSIAASGSAGMDVARLSGHSWLID